MIIAESCPVKYAPYLTGQAELKAKSNKRNALNRDEDKYPKRQSVNP